VGCNIGEIKVKILITGHCGFIGQVAWRYLSQLGHDLYGIDDLSRSTSIPNSHPNSYLADICDISRIKDLDIEIDWVLHLAAQVSVVESISDPKKDFMTNVVGTFEILQFAKERGAGVIYASTNKVFGELKNACAPIEDLQPVLPETNYGVSKCSGAQYVQDYAKGWVLHQSCIYGEAQIGDVNQGWIGWLRQQISRNESITCFGDGNQVRDLLHVNDLVELYYSIMVGKIKKGSYIVGGGIVNSYSFSEVVSLLGGKISSFEPWRLHDQKYFVSANSGLVKEGWLPKTLFHESLNEF
jgi:CDP-paratose 2-epimerase